ncbi:hypothetical protein J437_LFUL012622 [Ladona fulva]|uniref:Uncharacterized protein n=1 Tax=Ladona fulva TaxID=123851 RepID=A0A8K0KDM7_LADFU|nr:hypothetical protein J437_LFUL012622 [Ladona fulva]
MESTTTPAPESPYTMEDYKFSWVDYCVFSIMLMFSTAIGIYYGFFEKKKDDIGESDSSDHLRRVSKGLEYLTGGSRDLKPFPVAMSLVARSEDWFYGNITARKKALRS